MSNEHGMRYYAKVAIGTAAALLLGTGLMGLMQEEHDYTTGLHEESVKERKARTDNSNWSSAHYFINKDNLAIFWRRWLPKEGDKIKGIVVFSHGLGEHSGRYHKLGELLASKGYAVYAMDHQGHGQSEGTRLYVKWFSDFITDVHHLTEIAKAEHPDVEKVHLLGHSMGALIAIHAVNSAPKLYDGVVLSAPPLKTELHPTLETASTVIANLVPKLPAPGLDLSTLCRDQAVVDRYHNDPLNNQGFLRIRLVGELVEAYRKVPEFSSKFPIPYILLHGTADRMCLHEGSVGFHESTEIEDKKFVSIDGAYHELFNEPDGHSVNEAITWLESRHK